MRSGPILGCWLLLLLVVGSRAAQAQDCGCTNCPLPIFSETTTSSAIDVIVDGPNDLGQCGLTQVCFEITHTWIGDLSVSLTSPSGLQYLVMADVDNTFNGCGNAQNDANVCITLGTGNPLTNNEEYTCNGAVPCLNGDWTVPCGGVVDPETPAVQTPNCDLNDFNIPGDPANGTWTLTVSDICPLDVGSLDNWYLVFDCGTVECIQCEAESGDLSVTSVEACEGSADLIYSGLPIYSGTAPDTAEYNYTYLISQNDTILEIDTLPDLSTYAPGIYSICGFSYLATYENDLPNLLGTDVSVLYAELPFCSDLTDQCASIEIFAIPPPTQVDTILCFGECLDTPDGNQYCNSGPLSYTLLNVNGCDSLVEVNLTILPLNNTTDTVYVCAGESVSINGIDYSVGDHQVVLTSVADCDSLVDLTIIEVLPEAVVNTFGVLSCVDQQITIDGSTSFGDTYTWIDENGVVLGSNPTLDINVGGDYSLIVTLPATNGVCADTFPFTVQDTSALPVGPFLTSMVPTVLCEGEQYTFTASAYPDVLNYTWTLPVNATLISSSSDQSSITIEFTGPGIEDLCVAAVNGCGLGAENCFSLDATGLVENPSIMGDLDVCPGTTATYCITDDPEASTYTWTVTTGNIVSGQGTNCVEVAVPAGGTSLCVTSSNDCGSSLEGCIDITTTPLVSDPVFAIAPTEACVGQTADFFLLSDLNATDFDWTFPSNTTVVDGGDGFAFASITWSVVDPAANVCVVSSNVCGASNETCFELSVIDVPELLAVTGPDTACVGGTIELCVPPAAFTTEYTWTVSTSFDILSGQGTECVTLEVLDDLDGTVSVTAGNDCGLSSASVTNLLFETTPVAPQVDGVMQACEGEEIIFTASGVPNASGYSWNLSACGQIVAGQGTDQITVLVDDASCGSITACVSANNLCGSGASACFTTTTIPLPDAFAGDDETHCASFFLLEATASSATASWSFLSGPDVPFINNPTNNASSVIVNMPGTYEFVWTVTQNGCTARDTVSHTTVEDMILVNAMTDCDLSIGEYALIFEIQGGEAPYSVDGNFPCVINGNVVTCSDIPGGAFYNLTVSDNSGCFNLPITGVDDCSCTTLAPLLENLPDEGCINEELEVTLQLPPNLDPDDVLLYYVHTAANDPFGTSILQSPTAVFSFLPGTMILGQTYYVTAVVGTNALGIPDPDDPCLSISNTVPIVFNDAPSFIFDGPSVTCDTDPIELSFAFTGEAPFTVNTDFMGTFVVYGMDTLITTNLVGSNATLTGVTDATGCGVETPIMLTIDIVIEPTAELVSDTISVCNTNGTNDISEVNFSALILNGDPGGTWTDLDGSGATGTFPILDFLNVVPGVYTFQYATTSAQAPCENNTYLIEVEVVNCTCPEYQSGDPLVGCNGGTILALDDLIIGGYAVQEWQLVATPVGADDLPVIIGESINVTGADPGVYEILPILAQPPAPGCPLPEPLELLVEQAPNSSLEVLSQTYCEDEMGLINLDDGLSPLADPNGFWIEYPLVSGQLNGNTLDVNAFAAGDYYFYYVSEGTDECPNDSTLFTLTIHPLPLAIAYDTLISGTPEYESCFASELELGNASMIAANGPNVVYEWSSQNGTPIFQDMTATPTIEGLLNNEEDVFYLTAIDTVTGCEAYDEITVVYTVLPELDLSILDNPCHGDKSGLVAVESVSGGAGPYTYQLFNEAGQFFGTNNTGAFSGLSADAYLMTVEDVTGSCYNEVPFTVNEPQPLEIDFVVNNDQVGQEYIVNNDQSSFYEIVIEGWNINDPALEINWSANPEVETLCPSCLNQFLVLEDTTLLSVSVLTPTGCLIQRSLLVQAKDPEDSNASNIFSPNGDGVNDIFTIYGGEDVVRIIEMQVYDRWGDLVFLQTNIIPNEESFGWDGTFRGERANEGVYAWFARVEYRTGVVEIITGDVMLVW